jgi:threonine/homoserine/homoserine lactone efflux protein
MAAGYVFFAARAIGWLRRPRMTALPNRVSAAVLAAFAVVTVAGAE